MNEHKKKKSDLVDEAEMQPVSVPEPTAKKYTLRGAQQTIAQRRAAIEKREEKILKLKAENKADRELIQKLETICDQLRKGEIVRRIGHLCGPGNALATARINKLLDFCEQVGDALPEVSAEQLIGLIRGLGVPPAELTAEAQERYDANTCDSETEDTEQEE